MKNVTMQMMPFVAGLAMTVLGSYPVFGRYRIRNFHDVFHDVFHLPGAIVWLCTVYGSD